MTKEGEEMSEGRYSCQLLQLNCLRNSASIFRLVVGNVTVTLPLPCVTNSCVIKLLQTNASGMTFHLFAAQLL